MQALRTKFLFDDTKYGPRAIGRVDDNGNIYTMAGNPSLPFVQTKRGPYPSGAHMRRERLARNLIESVE